MLRQQFPDKHTELPMPVLGINLRDPQHLLAHGEAVLMQQCYFDGGIRPTPGVSRVTPTALAASTRIRGGHKAYFVTSGRLARRLVAYGTTISFLDDAGNATILTNDRTADKETYFTTWSTTDKVYLANGIDNLASYDGSAYATITGTSIPTPTAPLVPVLDRLFAIVGNLIEHTNPRSDSIWSNNSAWATFRPVRPGPFTVMHPFSLRDSGSIFPGALAFQANAYYIITGSDYGSDVTSVSPTTGYNASIQLLDPTIGTSSPRGICTVPGVGIFWFTSDLNVYHLPEGSLRGFYLGDRLISRTATTGIESCNLAALDQVQLSYFDRKLMLRFPSGNSAYANREFWLDLRYELSGENKQPVWYGPMNTSTVGPMWREDQSGELALYGGEANAATGAYVYKLYETSLVSHAIGAATVLPTVQYQTPYRGYDGGSTEKYVPRVRMTAVIVGALPTIGVTDLNYVGAIQGVVSRHDG